MKLLCKKPSRLKYICRSIL